MKIEQVDVLLYTMLINQRHIGYTQGQIREDQLFVYHTLTSFMDDVHSNTRDFFFRPMSD